MNWKIIGCELAFIAGMVILSYFAGGCILERAIYFLGAMIVVSPVAWLVNHFFYLEREKRILKEQKEEEKLKRERYSQTQSENIKGELQNTIEELRRKVEKLEKDAEKFDQKMETELKKFYLIILAKHASGSSKTLKASFEDMRSLYNEYKDITSD